MTKRTKEDLEQEKAFIDAGFTKEKMGSVTVYKRAVPDDLIDAAVHIASKRTIGYTSKDFPPPPSSKRKSKG